MAPLGRKQPPISRGGEPIGFGQEELAIPAAAAAAAAGPSPWTLAVATSVVGAVTGWVVEEIAKGVRGRGRGRR